jgi:hypothetical protein
MVEEEAVVGLVMSDGGRAGGGNGGNGGGSGGGVIGGCGGGQGGGGEKPTSGAGGKGGGVNGLGEGGGRDGGGVDGPGIISTAIAGGATASTATPVGSTALHSVAEVAAMLVAVCVASDKLEKDIWVVTKTDPGAIVTVMSVAIENAAFREATKAVLSNESTVPATVISVVTVGTNALPGA